VGHDVSGKGKRADALMKTKGAIEALCFVEIKAHTTPLLQNSPYLPGCWALSEHLAGGVAQVQGKVENALRRLAEKIEPATDDGEPTGEELFAYQPKSFLVVGRLDELRSDRGVNIEKYRSSSSTVVIPMARRSSRSNELFQRARFIVEHLDT
jgi:hypothetical protein